jgi:hypothetical protein
MTSLRSRKEAAKSPLSDGDGSGGTNVHRLAFSKKGPSSSSSLFHPGWIGVGAFIVFIVFLKATAPVPNGRFGGMSMPKNGEHKSMFRDGRGKQVQKVSRRGKVNHKAITTVKKEDLKGLIADLPDNVNAITYEEAIQGRERLVEILTDAGVEELDVPTVLSLPKWSQVSKLYGEGPVVIGLETCEKFRQTIPLDDASIGTAGAYITNCGRCCNIGFPQPSTNGFRFPKACSTLVLILLACILKLTV